MSKTYPEFLDSAASVLLRQEPDEEDEDDGIDDDEDGDEDGDGYSE